jgi:soluble lytic murein transglycosylase-like protein
MIFSERAAMCKKTLLFILFALLCGCSDGTYLPYAPHTVDRSRLHSVIVDASARHGVPAALVNAVVMAESSGNAAAVSPAGALGLMQLMPATAAGCGVTNAFDAAQNVDCGTRYLHGLLTRYHDNVALAVAAYNAGPGAVDRYHGVPPYAETKAYVSRVLTAYGNY